jgi:hypothetical protein
MSGFNQTKFIRVFRIVKDKRRDLLECVAALHRRLVAEKLWSDDKASAVMT